MVQRLRRALARAGGLACRGAQRGMTATASRTLRLRRQRPARRGAMRFALQRAHAAATALARRLASARVLGALRVRILLHRDAGAPRLREADRDRLRGRARAVLAAPDVV